MSEQDGVITTSPVESNSVPKERLDELIAQRNMIAEQNKVLQDLLRQAVPTQQQAPVQEPEYLARLKEENLAAYQAFKSQEAQVKRSNATMFQLMEADDRRQLTEEFGDEGKKLLPQVEAKLQELRSQGIHTYNRGQIFYHLKGQEAVKAIKAPKPQEVSQAAQPQNLPSQNPSSASTIASGSAAPISRAATIEELEARYGDVPL